MPALGLLAPFAESDMKKESEMMQVNIVALTELTRLFVPSMVRRKTGHVLNVASTAAFVPGPYMAVYYATKAYVLSFSEAIATELKSAGVKVSVLCPGPTKSGFQVVAGMGNSKLVYGRQLPTSREVAHLGFSVIADVDVDEVP